MSAFLNIKFYYCLNVTFKKQILRGREERKLDGERKKGWEEEKQILCQFFLESDYYQQSRSTGASAPTSVQSDFW